MFEKDITDAVMSKRVIVEQVGKPLPVKMLADKVSATLSDGVKVTGVTVSSNAGEAYKVGISKPRHAAVYVNQYTGEVLCEYQRLPQSRQRGYLLGQNYCRCEYNCFCAFAYNGCCRVVA